MDAAYDHIQEEAFPDVDKNATSKPDAQASSLNADFQEAYKAISSSPWGARLGGFLGSVVKQGENVYKEASSDLSALSQDATRGFTDIRESIINRTRSLSLNTKPAPGTEGAASSSEGDKSATPTTAKAPGTDEDTYLSRLRSEAAKRLKDIQKAEDAADEALLKFGSNIRDFLREAITIAPPSGSRSEGQGSTVLFESKDASGKRVIHTSRFDAQLHVIHTNPESFTKDPAGEEYGTWSKEFEIDKRTGDISGDLAKYPELRSTMEKLVPQQIPYADFWRRYYFLRHSIETAEARRRDLLKAASAEEDVAWDEDSDDEGKAEKAEKAEQVTSTASSTTLHPSADNKHLKPTESRKSNDEKSQADSEASYDVVGAASGNPSQAPSQAPNSPREPRKGEESDEEDWE